LSPAMLQKVGSKGLKMVKGSLSYTLFMFMKKLLACRSLRYVSYLFLLKLRIKERG
jgi:hypothetical protein